MHLMTKKKPIWLTILPLLASTLISTGYAGTVTVSWDPNPEPDLAGYKIYLGRQSRHDGGVYDGLVDVGNQTSFTFNNLDDKFPGERIYFAVTAYDFSGNESAFSDEVSIVVGASNANRPELVAVNVLGETQVDVIFSEPLEVTSAQTQANYSISNGIQVLGAVLDANQTTVHLVTSAHIRGQTYTLTVSGVKDLDGNEILAGSSRSYTLPAAPADTEPPSLVSVAVLDASHLEVIFSEAVEQGSAENNNNYRIDNGVQVLQAKRQTKHSVVHLTTTQHQPGLTYTLTVNNVADLASTPNTIAENSSITYRVESGGQTDTTPPELVSVVVQGPTQIDVNFSEPVEKSSAEDKNNYAIDPGVQVLGAILDGNLSTVHLVTAAHKKDVEYTLTVSGVRDRANTPNSIAAGSTITYMFSSEEDLGGGDNSNPAAPRSFTLFQNYPNPFNPETEIRFYLDKQRSVELRVYNTLGQVVKSLVKAKLPAGFHTVVWDGTNDAGRQMPSGVYMYSLEVKREVQKGNLLVNVSLERRVKKMTLVR